MFTVNRRDCTIDVQTPRQRSRQFYEAIIVPVMKSKILRQSHHARKIFALWKTHTMSRHCIQIPFLGRVFESVQDATTHLICGVEKTTEKMSFYSLVDKDMAGNEVKMSDFSGNVLLLVNVASK